MRGKLKVPDHSHMEGREDPPPDEASSRDRRCSMRFGRSWHPIGLVAGAVGGDVEQMHALDAEQFIGPRTTHPGGSSNAGAHASTTLKWEGSH